MFSRFTASMFFLIFLVFTGFVSASVIQITSTLEVPEIINSTSFLVNVSLVNTGDEDAKNVQLEFILPAGFSADTVYVGVLSPNRISSNSVEVVVAEGVVGNYPLFLRTHYTDANSYPFSMVTGTYLRVGSSPPVNVHAKTSKAELYGSSGDEINVFLLNRDVKSNLVDVKLVVPNEFKAGVYERQVTLEPQSETGLVFPIENFGALPGSRYFGFFAVEFEQEGVHNTAITSVIIDVFEEKNIVPSNMVVVFGAVLFAVLLLLFVLYQFKGKA